MCSIVPIILFIFICIFNIILMTEKDKFVKLSKLTNITSFIYAIALLIGINIYYINYIKSNSLGDAGLSVNGYFGIIKQLNLAYFRFTLAAILALLILSFKKLRINYDILFYITLIILVVAHIYLFFEKGILIIKGTVDMSSFSSYLRWCYLHFITLPLAIAKYRKEQ